MYGVDSTGDPEVDAGRLVTAGAVVTEVDGILTREMLDGLDNFWRARMWDDLSKLSAEDRGKVLPYIYRWGEAGAKLSGVDVVRGFNMTMAIRAAASSRTSGSALDPAICSSATSPRSGSRR